MTDAWRTDKYQKNAAILLWQSRFRLLLIIAVGGITLALKLTGRVTELSVIAQHYGAERALGAFLVLSSLYFGFVSLLATRLRRTNRIGSWALPATLVADLVAFNGAVLIGAPPAWYEVALILSMFSLQLALLYSGWRAAMWSLVLVVAAYLTMLGVALNFGSDVRLDESFWTLGVFTLGMTAFATLHADLSARLSMIVRAFDKAREGVFSLSFDEDSGEEPDGITVIGTAYEKMKRQLTSLILTDPLTECFNPRGFEQFCMRELARAARNDTSLALLALDIDHFKSINDTYGHLAGDDVLRDLGGLLRKTARLSDVTGRLGGEEFAILAPDTDERGAVLFAERVLEACRNHRFEPLQGRQVTVSIGIAAARAKTENVLHVLRARADDALYVAKRGGRNRALVWVEGMQGEDAALPAAQPAATRA